MANHNTCLKIVDVRDPANPVVVGTIITDYITWEVSTMEIGGIIYALVADDQAGLNII